MKKVVIERCSININGRGYEAVRYYTPKPHYLSEKEIEEKTKESEVITSIEKIEEFSSIAPVIDIQKGLFSNKVKYIRFWHRNLIEPECIYSKDFESLQFKFHYEEVHTSFKKLMEDLYADEFIEYCKDRDLNIISGERLEK